MPCRCRRLKIVVIFGCRGYYPIKIHGVSVRMLDGDMSRGMTCGLVCGMTCGMTFPVVSSVACCASKTCCR